MRRHAMRAIGAVRPPGKPGTPRSHASTYDFATHHVPLHEAPQAYETFQKKADGAFKILLKP